MGFIKRFLKNLLEEFLKNKKRSTPALCKEMIPEDRYTYNVPPPECTPDVYIGQYLQQRKKIKKNEYELNVRNEDCFPIIELFENEKLTINFYDDKKIEFCNPYPDSCLNTGKGKKPYAPIYIQINDNSELIINTVGSEMPMINDKPLINYIGGAGNSLYCSKDAERNYKVSINYNWNPPSHKKKIIAN
jgi:hypothetical protein